MSALADKGLQLYFTNKYPTTSSLPIGSLVFTHSGSLYLVADGISIPISTVITVNSEADLDSTYKEEGKLYLTKDKNKLYTYNNNEFVLVSGDDTPKGYDLISGNLEILVPSLFLFSKQIYAAMIPIGALPATAGVEVKYTHNIPNIDFVYKVEGFAKGDNTLSPNRIVFNNTATGLLDNTIVSLNADTNNIYIKVNNDLSAYTESYVIVYYIKKDVIDG